MIVIVLSLLDIIAALWYFLDIPYLAATIGIIILLKGLITFIPAITSGYYYDWMGLTDILSGIILILHSYSLDFSFGFYVISILAFKGLYSIFRRVTGLWEKALYHLSSTSHNFQHISMLQNVVFTIHSFCSDIYYFDEILSKIFMYCASKIQSGWAIR